MSYSRVVVTFYFFIVLGTEFSTGARTQSVPQTCLGWWSSHPAGGDEDLCLATPAPNPTSCLHGLGTAA